MEEHHFPSAFIFLSPHVSVSLFGFLLLTLRNAKIVGPVLYQVALPE
jgi:hypothetical protein